MTDAAPILVDPRDLKSRLNDGNEIALLDVREEGRFAEGHLFFAANLPSSRLELRLDALVPRRTAPIVLCDGGDGLAEKVARRIRCFGYRDVSALVGGTDGWRAAGFELFTGINVPSKAFGEFIEHRHDTPRIAASDLKARLDRGERIVILDSRPFAEYHRMNIPGAIDCPGAELVLRVRDLAPDPETLVVVNCAGRTRSIIGAQSLLNARIPNRVLALKDGTMGWHLAGFGLETDSGRRAPAPSAPNVRWAAERAHALAERCGVRTIGADTLDRFQSESGRRTLYLLDVRSPEDYVAGHRPGSRSAPGGQLVQATDAYVGVRGARLVLIDDLGVRAWMTASWLRQMGWRDVYVLDAPFVGAEMETGPEPTRVLGLDDADAETVSAEELANALDTANVRVIDLATSLQYRAGHIPGAAFAQRVLLGGALDRFPECDTLAFTCPDGYLARLAAAEWRGRVPGARRVCALAGGTAAWSAEGHPCASGDERLLSPPDDVWYRAYDRTAGVEESMRDYLSWEVALLEQIKREGDVGFVPLTA